MAHRQHLPMIKQDILTLSPVDLGENARREMVLTLENFGFEIEASHHELAPGQHEIDFKYSDALDIADKIITFKMVVRTVAQRHGLHATFLWLNQFTERPETACI